MAYNSYVQWWENFGSFLSAMIKWIIDKDLLGIKSKSENPVRSMSKSEDLVEENIPSS